MFAGSRKLDERRSVALIELATGSVAIQWFTETYDGGKLQQIVFNRDTVLAIGGLILEMGGKDLRIEPLEAKETGDTAHNSQSDASRPENTMQS